MRTIEGRSTAPGSLEAQATPSVTLLQVPPAGASGGMRIGVLLPVLAVIIGSRVVELTRVGTWIPAAVGIAVAGMPLACLGGISRGDGCGHDGDRQQLGDEKSHGRSSAWIVFGVGASRVQPREETQHQRSASTCA